MRLMNDLYVPVWHMHVANSLFFLQNQLYSPPQTYSYTVA
jgi:hypothetical protein